MKLRQLALSTSVLLLAILTGCASTANGNDSGAPRNPDPVPATSDAPPAAPTSAAPAPAPAPAAGSVAASATRPSDISGLWAASDGSPVKTIASSGQCTGMYYNGTTPLDIGGPMSCTLGQNKAAGYYLLVVRQPPNQASYEVRFSDDNTMTMYTPAGTKIVTLTRQ